MKIVSKLHEKCKKCPHIDSCDEKRMEACAYMEIPDPILALASYPAADYASAEVLVKHDYRDIKINCGMTVPLDLEAVKKQLERDIYKAAGCYFAQPGA